MFCQDEPEPIEHFLFLCRVSFDLWKHVSSWLKTNNICVMSLNISDLIFGKFEMEDFLLVNHIIDR